MQATRPSEEEHHRMELDTTSNLDKLRADLRAVTPQLRKAQAALRLGPISLAKAQKAPELFDQTLAALRAAPDPSNPDPELASLLRTFESSRKKTKAGYVVPSAEGNWVAPPERKVHA